MARLSQYSPVLFKVCNKQNTVVDSGWVLRRVIQQSLKSFQELISRGTIKAVCTFLLFFKWHDFKSSLVIYLQVFQFILHELIPLVFFVNFLCSTIIEPPNIMGLLKTSKQSPTRMFILVLVPFPPGVPDKFSFIHLFRG